MTTDRRGPPGPVQPVPVQPGPAAPGPPGRPAETRAPRSPSRREVRLAEFSYLGVAIAGIVPPLAVYLVSRRRAAFARAHAAEALRMASAVILYGICALIIATMLALDSVEIAVIVICTLALALWLVMVVFLVRAARAAGRGEPYEFPSWLRVAPRR